MYWKTYLDNEQVLNDIQETANENVSTLRRIYNLEDYYESSLLPKMLSYPKQYINRIKDIREQRRVIETKQQESIRLFEQLAKKKTQKQATPPESPVQVKSRMLRAPKELSVGKQKTAPNPQATGPAIDPFE